MGVPQQHIETKNEASPFLGFAVSSCCIYGAGCRDCEVINSYYDFVRFQRNGPQSPPSHIEPLEMNYKIIILLWCIKQEQFANNKETSLLSSLSFLIENDVDRFDNFCWLFLKDLLSLSHCWLQILFGGAISLLLRW